MLKRILDHQHLIWSFVTRDLKGRYIGSMMGIFWTVIHPLSQIVVFSVVFSIINRAALIGLEGSPLGYTIFLCAGLLPWIAFQEFMMRVTGVFVANSNLIKKVNFPEEILVIQEMISSIITLTISYSLFTIIILVFGGWRPTLHILLLPGIVALQLFFSMGIAFFMATLNVFLRDIGQIMGVVLMTWFWLTPIVYPVQILFREQQLDKGLIIPEGLWIFFTLNPWYYLSKWYREAFYMGIIPEFNEVIVFVALSTLMVYLGIKVYKSLRDDIPDMI